MKRNAGAFLSLRRYLDTAYFQEDVSVKEAEMAMEDILRRAKVIDFCEFMRSYKYKKKELSMHKKNLLFGEMNSNYREDKIVFLSFTEILGHTAQIERLCFDNGSRFFISGGSDGMVKLWDAKTCLLIHSFIGHRGLINDFCVSNDGKILISCDFFGILNAWSLENFKAIFQLKLGCEITFAEFFFVDMKFTYGLAVVLSNGTVLTYKFCIENGIFDECENRCLLGEAIKGLCFTDGGRFLLCSGWWPFLTVFDTCRSDGCMVLETNGFPINTICGARNGLKIAAACDSHVFQWTFFVEGNSGMGNFKRRTRGTTVAGHWKKSVMKIEMEEGSIIDRIYYLKDNLLVCVCTDLRIRIFAGNELKWTIDSQEMGVVYPHPLKNAFAFCGSNLRIYDTDRLVYEENLDFSVNDAQFSHDGEFFIFGDERGAIKILSTWFLPKHPREQFFTSDFNHINSADVDGFIECQNELTFNSSRERNDDWRLIKYFTTEVVSSSASIENIGAKHFSRDFIWMEMFRRKYMDVSLQEDAYEIDTENSECDTTDLQVDSSGITESEFSEDQSTEASDNMRDDEGRNVPTRKLLIESDGEADEIHF